MVGFTKTMDEMHLGGSTGKQNSDYGQRLKAGYRKEYDDLKNQRQTLKKDIQTRANILWARYKGKIKPSNLTSGQSKIWKAFGNEKYAPVLYFYGNENRVHQIGKPSYSVGSGNQPKVSGPYANFGDGSDDIGEVIDDRTGPGIGKIKMTTEFEPKYMKIFKIYHEEKFKLLGWADDKSYLTKAFGEFPPGIFAFTVPPYTMKCNQDQLRAMAYGHGAKTGNEEMTRVSHFAALMPDIFTWYVNGRYVIQDNPTIMQWCKGEPNIHDDDKIEYTHDTSTDGTGTLLNSKLMAATGARVQLIMTGVSLIPTAKAYQDVGATSYDTGDGADSSTRGLYPQPGAPHRNT